MSHRTKTILWRIPPAILLAMLLIGPVRAEVVPTNEWVNFYSAHTTFNGDPVPVGTIVDAYDSSGVHCGSFAVNRAGHYGFLAVYRDYPDTTAVDEGAVPGDTLSFKINGYDAQVTGGVPVWTANGDVIELDLAATDGTVLFLNRFNIDAPATVTTNVPFTVQITAIDQRGHVFPSFSGPVHLTTSGSGVVIPDTVAGFVDGVAVVDLVYTRPEGIWLYVTDPVSSVTSSRHITVSGVAATNEWVSFFGEESLFNGMPLPVNAVVDAYDPDGVRCGTYKATQIGRYGFMPVYRDDPRTLWDEGAEPGDVLSFRINGFPAVPLGQARTPIWTANGDVRRFELAATDGVTRYLYRFSISTPRWVTLNTPFPITIRALDQRGDLFPTFTGPAYLSTTGSGLITPDQAASFVGGVATLDVSYDVPQGIRIVARNGDATVSGVSGYINVSGVATTNEWVSFFSENSTFNGMPLQSGWGAAVVDAYDSDGVRCGTFTVADNGKYGFMATYRDDPFTPIDEGASPGDTVSFTINGYDAQVTGGIPVWTANGDVIEVDLNATDGVSTYLNYFHVQAPPNAGANTPFPLTITAIDQHNEVFTGFSGAVLLTTTGTGAVSPTLVSSFADGVAQVDAMYDRTERIRIIATLQHGVQWGISPYIDIGVSRTNEWVSFYSASSVFQGNPVPVGSTIDAYDPDGDHCGTFRVETEGHYGFLSVYRDEPGTPQDEGASPGDTISFTINGYRAAATGDPPVWTGNGDVWNVNLNASIIHPPVISGLGDTSFAEDDALTLDLDDYVEDPEDPDPALTWAVTGNTNITVSINLATHVAQFSAPSHWHGAETMTFTVTDPLGSDDSAAITVTVIPVNDPPTVTSPPETTAVVSTPYVYPVQAHDPDNDPVAGAAVSLQAGGDTLTFSLTQSPAGMLIDPETGQITWSPALGDTGIHTVTVQVEDEALASDDQTYLLLVTETAIPPHVVLTVPADSAVGVLGNAEISARFDRDMDGVTINDTTFLVQGALSGPHSGVIGYLDAERTAIFIPLLPFLDGELVTARLTDAIRSADGDTLLAHTWQFTVGAPTLFEIAGKVTYYADTSAVVADAWMILSVHESDSVQTDEAGLYRFEDLAPGNYVVRPRKRDDVGEGTVSAFDASMVLRNRAGLLALNPEQRIAADVTGDSTVSAFDAANILMRVVGSLAVFPVGEWTFIPDSTAYALDADRLHEDYLGIVYGDVSGNWPGILPPPRQVADAARSAIVRDLSAPSGNDLTVSVHLDDAEGILSAAMTLRYDSKALRVSQVQAGAMTADYSIAHHASGGSLRIALAGSHPLSGSGELVTIAFEGDDRETIRLLDLQLNEGRIPVAISSMSPESLPEKALLGQNYPNPFNPWTTITYEVVRPDVVQLAIYALTGQHIRTLVNGERPAGRYSVVWDGRDNSGRNVASGVYLYRMVAGEFSAVRKLVLTR